jgi:hypothetical protein
VAALIAQDVRSPTTCAGNRDRGARGRHHRRG